MIFFLQAFGPQLKIPSYLVWVLSIDKEKLDFFSRKQVTSLGSIFTSQDYFWVLNFHLLTHFLIFCGTFYDFWNAKRRLDQDHICKWMIKNKVICKKISKRWCKESRITEGDLGLSSTGRALHTNRFN